MTSPTDQSDVTSTDATPVASPHPILGPSIWTFGAMLWAYIVLGEYTTAGFIGEAIAGAILILVAAACWTIAVKRSLVAPLGRLRILGRVLFQGIIAILLSTGCALFMNFVGESSHKNQDVPMTLAFMVLGMVAFLGGQRLTGSADIRRLPKSFEHLPLIGAVLVSLGAVLHLIVVN